MMRMHGKGSYRISIVLVFSCGPAKKKKGFENATCGRFFFAFKNGEKKSPFP